MVAQLLGRPILLINANTVPLFVRMHLQLPPTAAEPLSKRIMVNRQRRTFQYRPHVRSKPRSLPQSKIILAHRTRHYTAVVPVAEAAAQ